MSRIFIQAGTPLEPTTSLHTHRSIASVHHKDKKDNALTPCPTSHQS